MTATASSVAVTIEARFGRPKSHYRKSGIKPDAPALPRADVDNISKAILDGLQDVMGDDSRVARLVVEKAWGSEGSTTVTITTGLHSDGATQ